MREQSLFTRRDFLATGAAAGVVALGGLSGPLALADAVTTPHSDIAALRQDIVNSPVRVGLHRAQVFTKVFRETEDKPWVLRKALAMREYFQTVPLYIRDHDGLAGAISELPGAMPVIVELGIGENNIYTGERPDREGYLQDKVPEEIRDYWKNRNMWGLYRTEILGQQPYDRADQVPQVTRLQLHLQPRAPEPQLRRAIASWHRWPVGPGASAKGRRIGCGPGGLSGGRGDIANRLVGVDCPVRRVPRRAGQCMPSRRLVPQNCAKCRGSLPKWPRIRRRHFVRRCS